MPAHPGCPQPPEPAEELPPERPMHILRRLWPAMAGALATVAVTGAVVAAPLPLELVLCWCCAGAGRDHRSRPRHLPAVGPPRPMLERARSVRRCRRVHLADRLARRWAQLSSGPQHGAAASPAGREITPSHSVVRRTGRPPQPTGQRTGVAVAQHGRRSAGAAAPTLGWYQPTACAPRPWGGQLPATLPVAWSSTT